MVTIVLAFQGKIRSILVEIFKNKSNYAIVNRNDEPIKIANPSCKSKYCLNYKPDFCVINKRSNKEIIFEILDTQSDEKTIADVVRCIFHRNCVKAIFITKDVSTAIDTDNVIDTLRQKFRKLTKQKVLEIIAVDGNLREYSKKQIADRIKDELN